MNPLSRLYAEPLIYGGAYTEPPLICEATYVLSRLSTAAHTEPPMCWAAYAPGRLRTEPRMHWARLCVEPLSRCVYVWGPLYAGPLI